MSEPWVYSTSSHDAFSAPAGAPRRHLSGSGPAARVFTGSPYRGWTGLEQGV
jgi:hypothetical protein